MKFRKNGANVSISRAGIMRCRHREWTCGKGKERMGWIGKLGYTHTHTHTHRHTDTHTTMYKIDS